MTESYWKRDDLYWKDGKCVYADQCSECKPDCDPEECGLFDAFLDGEMQADDILSDVW